MKLGYQLTLLLVVCSFFVGCATLPPKDYTNFRAKQPRSILVIPPRNLSAEVNANYSFYTQSVKSISELGYYVYPAVLVDQYFKQNGVSMADEMHQVPLAKIAEIFQSDAVLYIDVEQYGTKYVLLSSNIIVVASATLVDSKSGETLWQGRVDYNQPGSSGLVEALVEQVVKKLTDQAHKGAWAASEMLFRTKNQGFILGERHPDFGKPEA